MTTPEQAEAALTIADADWQTHASCRAITKAKDILYPLKQSGETTSEYAARILATEVRRLRAGIIATLDANRHLADGDDCTLKELKALVPEWENKL